MTCLGTIRKLVTWVMLLWVTSAFALYAKPAASPGLRSADSTSTGDELALHPPAANEIRIATYVDETGRVATEISDTGIGIPAADLARVREPFQQADSRLNRQYEGTGLGLAICDRLVRLHGGTLDIASAIGRGTRITVTLPGQP